MSRAVCEVLETLSNIILGEPQTYPNTSQVSDHKGAPCESMIQLIIPFCQNIFLHKIYNNDVIHDYALYPVLVTVDPISIPGALGLWHDIT